VRSADVLDTPIPVHVMPISMARMDVEIVVANQFDDGGTADEHLIAVSGGAHLDAPMQPADVLSLIDSHLEAVLTA